MGFIDTAPGTEIPVFYNVVHAVGRQCPNIRDDVKLVQYLLMAYYAKASPEYRPKGAIAVTGFCGEATLNWILKFQIDCNTDSPNSVYADNRVDRIRNKNFQGSISKTTYTLAYLNYGVMKFNHEAFVSVPALIPLENPLNVSPPSWDMVTQAVIPESGGG